MRNKTWFLLMCIFTMILFGPAIIVFLFTTEIYIELLKAPLIIAIPFWAFSIFKQKQFKNLEKFASDLKEIGETSYAKLIGLTSAGLENKDLYNAVFLVYIPSLDKVEKISKIILVNSKMYKIGTYYECKYLENEINITGFNPDVKNIPGSPLLLEEKFTEYINNI